jgi:hypothetical protein
MLRVIIPCFVRQYQALPYAYKRIVPLPQPQTNACIIAEKQSSFSFLWNNSEFEYHSFISSHNGIEASFGSWRARNIMLVCAFSGALSSTLQRRNSVRWWGMKHTHTHTHTHTHIYTYKHMHTVLHRMLLYLEKNLVFWLLFHYRRVRAHLLTPFKCRNARICVL